MVETPMDSDVLLVSGEFSFRRGEFQNAHLMLSKAAEQGSNSTRLLQLLGTVSHAMNRPEAAIECFQKLLRLNPKFQPAYTDIAIVLWEANRQREALAHLASALDHWPDFAGAAELYDRLRKEFRGEGAIPRPRNARYKLATHYAPGLFRSLSGTISRAINKVRRAGVG